jgi:hypothetical protein
MDSREKQMLIVDLATRALDGLDQAGRIALAERILRAHAEIDPEFGTYVLRTGIKRLDDPPSPFED